MKVLLVAHGSPAPQHAVTMRGVRDAVRARGVACEVAFLDHDAPLLPEAAAHLAAGTTVVAVPMLLNRAYHARVDIPSAVEATAAARPDLDLRTAAALGPDPLLVDAMERRLGEAGVDLATGGRDVGVVMVASGTSDEAARAAVAKTARDWSVRAGTVVRHAFVAGSGPGVAEAVTAVRDQVGADAAVALAPYLFETGVLLDRATAIAEQSGVDVVAAPLRDAPEVVDLILARAAAVV